MLLVLQGLIVEISPNAQPKWTLEINHFATSADLLAAFWRNRQDVYMLSTAHNKSVEIAMKRCKDS